MAKKKKLRQTGFRSDEGKGNSQQSVSNKQQTRTNLSSVKDTDQGAAKQNGSPAESKQGMSSDDVQNGANEKPSSSNKVTHPSEESDGKTALKVNSSEDVTGTLGTKKNRNTDQVKAGASIKKPATASSSATAQHKKSLLAKDRKPRREASLGKLEQRMSMRKGKIKDPRLIPRMREYLESRRNKNFVSIPQMAEYLQDKYPEYGRKKKSMFIQYVDKAYSYMEKPSFKDPPPPLSDTDENSTTEKELVEENGQYVWKNVSEHSREISDVDGEMEEGEEDGTANNDTFSSSEDEDAENLVEYKDSNAINNSLVNLYRNSPTHSAKATVDDKKRKTSEKPAVDLVKKSKSEERVLYPTPNVLERNIASTGVVGPRRTPSDKYFIDRKGDNHVGDKKDSSETKESREVTIQRFLGNLPSRTSFGTYVSGKLDPRLKGRSLYRVFCDKDESEEQARLSHSGITSDNVGVTTRAPKSPGSNEAANNEAILLTDPRKKPEEDKIDDGKQAGQDRHKQGRKLGKDNGRTPKKRKTASKSRAQGDSDTESGKKEKGLAVQKSSVTFADVGGNEANLTEICKLLVHMRHPEVYQQLGVTPPRGFLLHGPPGCGKTLLANAIAGELDLALIKVASTEIVSGVSGDSEEKIRELFEKAAQTAPCVVFIDEIDAITPKRETASKDMERRIVAQLLACMDDLNANPTCHVLVIGATNRPDSLDPALRRAGRFDREISLGIPDEQSRLRILQVLCRNLKLSSDFDFSYMAHNTPGYVGADLMALTREAAMTAVNRVFQDLQAGTSNTTDQQTCSTGAISDSIPDIQTGSRYAVKETGTDLTVDSQSGSSYVLAETGTNSAVDCQTGHCSIVTETSNTSNKDIVQTTPTENQSSSSPTQSGLNVNAIQSISTISAENQSIMDVERTEISSKCEDNLPKESKPDSASENIAKHSQELSVNDQKVSEVNGQNDKNEIFEQMNEDVNKNLKNSSKTSEDSDITENAERTQSDNKSVANNVESTEMTEKSETMCEMDVDDESADKCQEVSEAVDKIQGNIQNTKPADIERKSEYLSVLSWLKEHPPLSEAQLADLYITMEDFKEALTYVQPSAKREGFATIPGVTWDDIGALHEVREELQLAILAPVRHPEQFKSLGLTRAQGVLLAGPPGCGKTLLAKAVANESGINFISVKGPELLNMYVGESERAVRTVFQRARNSAPCVIFFDELDALCPRRSGHSEGNSSARVVNQLLTEMDGLEERKQVFIMAATNRPDIIDPAVLRPGRLDKTLYVGLPSVSDRLDILNCITKNGTKPDLADDVRLASISEDSRCECFTGADLAALVREASIAALKDAIFTKGRQSSVRVTVKGEHFDTAFRKIRPSVTAKDQERYDSMRSRLAIGT